MGKVSILDIGLGNIHSVAQAFAHVGTDVETICQAKDLHNAEFVIFPGVGAFGDGMRKLSNLRLVEPLAEYVASGRPLIGICLGMQLFFSSSYEFGEHRGLGLIEGEVLPFPEHLSKELNVTIPHTGWNTVSSLGSASLSECPTVIRDEDLGKDYYFVHSFYVRPKSSAAVAAYTRYGDMTFCSVVEQENIVGFQFHPEKSGPEGLKLIQRCCEYYGVL